MPFTARFKPFEPILAGATLRDRLFACAGALIGIALTGFLCGLAAGKAPHLLLLVPPMGASAVLVFAVPSSPMAQPWPVIGGNTISALAGIAVSHTISEPALAAGVAVGARHRRDVAAALPASAGRRRGAGRPVRRQFGAGYLFPLMPVALNATVLVACGLAYHRFSRPFLSACGEAGGAEAARTADRPRGAELPARGCRGDARRDGRSL